MASHVLVPHVPGSMGHDGTFHRVGTCASSARRSIPIPARHVPPPAAASAVPSSLPESKPVDPLCEDDPYKWDFLRELCQEEFGLEIRETPAASSPPAYTYTSSAARAPVVPVQRSEYSSPPQRVAVAASPEPPAAQPTIKHETVRRSTVDLSGLTTVKERYLGQQATDIQASSASTSSATSPVRPRAMTSSSSSSHDGSSLAGSPQMSSSLPVSRGTYGFMQGSCPPPSADQRARATSLVSNVMRTPSQEQREAQLITTYIPSALPPQQSAPPPSPPPCPRPAPTADSAVLRHTTSATPPRPARCAQELADSKTAALRNVFESVAAQRQAAQEVLQRRHSIRAAAANQLVKMPSDVSSSSGSSGSEAGSRTRCPDSPMCVCSWTHDAHKSAANTAPSSPDLRARFGAGVLPQPIEGAHDGHHHARRSSPVGNASYSLEWDARSSSSTFGAEGPAFVPPNHEEQQQQQQQPQSRFAAFGQVIL